MGLVRGFLSALETLIRPNLAKLGPVGGFSSGLKTLTGPRSHLLETLTGLSLVRLGPIGVFYSALKTSTGFSLAKLGLVKEKVTPTGKSRLDPIWQDWVQSGFPLSASNMWISHLNLINKS